uniref:Uncharacterized protein n=1 Tax=Varanus komodoensis TaxID=61221 RepID=A0A8D2LK09_VARKO
MRIQGAGATNGKDKSSGENGKSVLAGIHFFIVTPAAQTYLWNKSHTKYITLITLQNRAILFKC